jgi:WAS protein family homolog 1
MEGIYKIDLVPTDLSTEETILQIADTLDNLNGVVDDIFTRLLSRIKQNIDKSNKLNERIQVSKRKVESLVGVQTAIKVFSSAKYPVAISHQHYQSVFDLNGYKHKPQKFTLSGKSQGKPNEQGIQVNYKL